MAAITIEIDDDMKESLDELMKPLGLNFSSLFSICAAKFIRERGIPFYIELPEEEDPFYSEENMNHLRKSIAQLNAGRGVEHELIEAD